MPDDTDLAGVGCTISADDTVVNSATGAAILGHPLNAIVWLSEHLAQRGQTLPAGSVVLAGALTDAAPLLVGSHYMIAMAALGSLSARP